MTRIAMLALGYGFLALGVLGLFLPVLQGVLFIVVGLLILSRHASWAERLLVRLKARHPAVAKTVVAAEDLAARWSDWLARRLRRMSGR
ncbi:MAG: PGPGW domain-containing protein [Geminicoccaceae bacterium]|nr:PGPGW domain-containing protein [Geminicoccaceae bacterium]MCS7266807.1 PGPGW domain-containing protein [Geminicoccaceae bacterium]MCX7629049.1 PGPGW domain-containing protein [Geminicoccaceae bacterium]MDW8123828.1 PGPGW domain-containing protein [Geminicoccaceae bacterium]MDW8341194.1 PGPGW domain-containing protein [Geminicoccaceae bacterium]